jgi:hypothetical protein
MEQLMNVMVVDAQMMGVVDDVMKKKKKRDWFAREKEGN